MQEIPKKKIFILTISIIANALIFTLIAYLLTKVQTDYEKVPFGNLSLWRIIAIVFSLYGLVKPWGWKKKFLSISSKKKMTPQGITSFLILYCYAHFVSPLLYGLILVFWGSTFSEYLFFARTVVLDVLVWGAYNISKLYRGVEKANNQTSNGQ